MYHRFNESKYPSTNIQLDIFEEQLKIIQNEGIKFIHPQNFEENFVTIKYKEKFCLLWMMVFYHFIKMLGLFFKRKKNTFYFICKYTRSWRI